MSTSREMGLSWSNSSNDSVEHRSDIPKKYALVGGKDENPNIQAQSSLHNPDDKL
jgi:hypothetical protein